MAILVLGASKCDATAFAAQHLITDFEWASPRSEARVRGLSVTAIYATDKVRTVPEYAALLKSAEVARIKGV